MLALRCDNPRKHAGEKKKAPVFQRRTVFQHRFAFALPGIPHRSSDNYFDLYPDAPKTVRVKFTQPQTSGKLRHVLVHQSLVDTY